MTKNVFYPSHPQGGHPLQDLKEILQKGLEMEIKQVSDHTKVSLQMERLVRTCRLKGINVFDFLKTELAQVHELTSVETEQIPLQNEISRFECPVCKKTFKSLAALTGHGPHRCKTKLNSNC